MFSVGLAGRCFVRLYRSREAPRAKNSIDVKIARTDGEPPPLELRTKAEIIGTGLSRAFGLLLQMHL